MRIGRQKPSPAALRVQESLGLSVTELCTVHADPFFCHRRFTTPKPPVTCLQYVTCGSWPIICVHLATYLFVYFSEYSAKVKEYDNNEVLYIIDNTVQCLRIV